MKTFITFAISLLATVFATAADVGLFPATPFVGTNVLLQTDAKGVRETIGVDEWTTNTATAIWTASSNLVVSILSDYIGLSTNKVINVKEFGAIGDGVTDDTAALSAAAAAVTDGTEVIFPLGTYFINIDKNPYRNPGTPMFSLANKSDIKITFLNGASIVSDDYGDSWSGWRDATVTNWLDGATWRNIITTPTPHSMPDGSLLWVKADTDHALCTAGKALGYVLNPTQIQYTGLVPAACSNAVPTTVKWTYDAGEQASTVFGFNACSNVVFKDFKYVGHNYRNHNSIQNYVGNRVIGLTNQCLNVTFNGYIEGAATGIGIGTFSQPAKGCIGLDVTLDAVEVGYALELNGVDQADVTMTSVGGHRGLYAAGVNSSTFNIDTRDYNTAGMLLGFRSGPVATFGDNCFGCTNVIVNIRDTGTTVEYEAITNGSGQALFVLSDYAYPTTNTVAMENVSVTLAQTITPTVCNGGGAISVSKLQDLSKYKNVVFSGSVDASTKTSANYPINVSAGSGVTEKIDSLIFDNFKVSYGIDGKGIRFYWGVTNLVFRDCSIVWSADIPANAPDSVVYTGFEAEVAANKHIIKPNFSGLDLHAANSPVVNTVALSDIGTNDFLVSTCMTFPTTNAAIRGISAVASTFAGTAPLYSGWCNWYVSGTTNIGVSFVDDAYANNYTHAWRWDTHDEYPHRVVWGRVGGSVVLFVDGTDMGYPWSVVTNGAPTHTVSNLPIASTYFQAGGAIGTLYPSEGILHDAALVVDSTGLIKDDAKAVSQGTLLDETVVSWDFGQSSQGVFRDQVGANPAHIAYDVNAPLINAGVYTNAPTGYGYKGELGLDIVTGDLYRKVSPQYTNGGWIKFLGSSNSMILADTVITNNKAGFGTNAPAASVHILAPAGGAIAKVDVAGVVAGNALGIGAVDWGTRNTATMVASGPNSVIGGGTNNTANNSYSTVSGGRNNTASAVDSIIAGGGYNAASANYSAIGGGTANTASGAWSGVGSGWYNTASGQGAYVGGGHTNRATGVSSFVGGGTNNIASAYGSAVLGGNGNTASANSFVTVGGGTANLANGYASTVPGGFANTASGTYSGTGSGFRNTANTDGAYVGGGHTNRATGVSSFVGGGTNNLASGYGAAVLGGSGNTSSGTCALTGGQDNTADGIYSGAFGIRNQSSGVGAFAFGVDAKSPLRGQISFSAGASTLTADAQTSFFVARRSIQANGTAAGPGAGITNVANPLFLDGDTGTARMTLPYTAVTQTNSFWTFRAQVTANAVTNNVGTVVNRAGYYEIIGGIDRREGTTTIRGAVVTEIYETADWTVSATADDTNDALIINVDSKDDCARAVATVWITQLLMDD